MGGRGQICAEKFPVISVSSVPSRKSILTPHSVSARGMWFPPSKEYPLSGKGEEKSNLTIEKLTTTTSDRWSRSTSTMLSDADCMYVLWPDEMRMALHLCDRLPQNALTLVILRKNCQQISTKGRLTKYLTVTLQNYQGHHRQGKCGKLSQRRET